MPRRPRPRSQRLSELDAAGSTPPPTPRRCSRRSSTGVVEVLGYGVAAIARLEGDTLVMTAFAGPEDLRRSRSWAGVRRRRQILDEFRPGRPLGHPALRPARADGQRAGLRAPGSPTTSRRRPDGLAPRGRALRAALLRRPASCSATWRSTCRPTTGSPRGTSASCWRCSWCRPGWRSSNAQQRERLAEQVRAGSTVKEVAQAGSQPSLDAILTEAGEARRRGAGRDPGLDPLLSRRGPAPTGWPPATRAATRRARGIAEPAAPDLVGAVARRPDPVEVHGGRRVLRGAAASLPDAAGDDGTRSAPTSVVVVPDGRGASSCSATSSSASRRARPAPSPPSSTRSPRSPASSGRSVHSARLLETEQRLVSELRELDRYKGELITTISHELKTPLTTIIGHAELLGDAARAPLGRGDHPQRRAAQPARAEPPRLLPGAGPPRLGAGRHRPRRGLPRRASTWWPTSPTPGRCRLELATCPRAGDGAAATPRSCRWSSTTWSTTPSSTPAAAGPCGSRSSCDASLGAASTSATPGWASPRPDQVHLFSAFHRSSNPEALSIPGTGLGLAISRRIVETHGGPHLGRVRRWGRAAPSRCRCHGPPRA